MRNSHRLIAALIIVVQCLLVAQLTGGFGFAMLSIALAVLAVWISVPIHSILYLCVVAISAVVVGLTTASKPLDVPTDWLLPGQYVAAASQVLIVAQLLELVRTDYSESMSSRFSAIALLSLMIAFCRAETDYNSVLFYIVAVVMTWLIALLGAKNKNRNASRVQTAKRGRAAKFVLAAMLLLALAGGTGYFANTAKGATGLLRYFISQRVTDSIIGENAIVAFTASGNLGSVNELKQSMPDKVVVDVTCDFRPGYLRGRVFTTFENGRWERSDDERVSCNRVAHGKMVTLPAVSELPRILDDVFAIDLGTGNTEPFRYVEVTNREQLIGDVFFSTLNSDYVVGALDSVEVDQDDVVYSGASTHRPTRYYVSRDRNATQLKQTYREELLTVNERIQESLTEVAGRICERTQTFDEKVVAVESFFQSNFKYSLNPFFSSRSDRISDFVLNQRAAHCEYFATAAAMLLRLNGIPTRYVTGFTVEEQSASDDNDGEMWIARNQDAHAWVEAFDESEQQWRIVEATPGVNVARGLWQQMGSQVGRDLQIEKATAGGKSFGERLFLWFDMVFRAISGAGQWLTTAVNVLLVCAIPFLARRWYVRSMGKHGNYKMKGHAARLRRLDRRLAKFNLVREPSETLHQFAKRILEKPLSDQKWIEEAAIEYRRYAEQRYLCP